MKLSFAPDEISEIVQARGSRGATGATVTGISALGAARAGDLSFLGNAKYKPEVAATEASVVLLPMDYAGEPKPGQLFLLVDNPSAALARLCTRIEHSLWPAPRPGIHPSAVVSPEAAVAASASVGPLCVIEAGARVGEDACLEASVFVGRDVVLGDGCRLMPGVRIYAGTVVGRRVRIHANAVLGADGFGYEFVNGRHEKIPQIGNVVIGDDVEIGAGTMIDRARFGHTSVGEGTKIDNLVQVGHNCIIGRYCILCAQVGLSGSTVVEDYAVLAGQVGVAGHLTIGRGAKIGGQAGVTTDIPAGSAMNGTPVMPLMLERRIAVLRQRLPDLFRRVDALEEAVRRSAVSKPIAD